MKKSLIAAALCLLFQAPVGAQLTGNGFQVGLDASFESMKVKSAGSTDSFGSGTSVILNGGYEWGYGKKYALITGGFIDLDYWLQGGSGSTGTQFSKGSETLNQKIKWGLYAAPGFYLSDTSLVYAKLIYSSMKTDPEGVRSGAPNFNSTGYGLGLRYTVAKDNFISLEWAALPVGKASFSSFRSGAEISPGLSMISIGWSRRL